MNYSSKVQEQMRWVRSSLFTESGRVRYAYLQIFEGNFFKAKFYLNNYGNHTRDFTYIDDATEILYKLLNVKILVSNSVVNICSNNPIRITRFLEFINKYFKKVKIYKGAFKSRCKKNTWIKLNDKENGKK